MGTSPSPDGGVAVRRDGHGGVSGPVGGGSWVSRGGARRFPPPRLPPPAPPFPWKRLLSRAWSRPRRCSVRLLRLLPALPHLSRVFLRSVSGILWCLLWLRRLWPEPGVRASRRLLLSLLRSEGNLPFRSRHPSGQRLL